MPEDIPEGGDIFMPPENGKPDFGKYQGVLGIVLGLLFTTILANTGEVNWIVSIFVYFGILVFAVWSFIAHATPHKGKNYRRRGVTIYIILIGGMGYYGTLKQYRREHSPPPPIPATPSDVKKEGTATRDKLGELENVLATNPIPTATRLALMDAEHTTIMGNISNNTQESQRIRFQPFSINVLKQIASNKEALQISQMNLEENERKEEVLKSQLSQNDRQAENDREEKLENDQHLQLYDYAIRKLQTDIAILAAQSGQIETDDFPTGPTISPSNMVKDGKIISGINHIHLGTNSSWSFAIFTDYRSINEQAATLQGLKIWLDESHDELSLSISENSIKLKVPTFFVLGRIGYPISTWPNSNDNIDTALNEFLAEELKRFPLTQNNN